MRPEGCNYAKGNLSVPYGMVLQAVHFWGMGELNHEACFTKPDPKDLNNVINIVRHLETECIEEPSQFKLGQTVTCKYNRIEEKEYRVMEATLTTNDDNRDYYLYRIEARDEISKEVDKRDLQAVKATKKRRRAKRENRERNAPHPHQTMIWKPPSKAKKESEQKEKTEKGMLLIHIKR